MKISKKWRLVLAVMAVLTVIYAGVVAYANFRKPPPTGITHAAFECKSEPLEWYLPEELGIIAVRKMSEGITTIVLPGPNTGLPEPVRSVPLEEIQGNRSALEILVEDYNPSFRDEWPFPSEDPKIFRYKDKFYEPSGLAGSGRPSGMAGDPDPWFQDDPFERIKQHQIQAAAVLSTGWVFVAAVFYNGKLKTSTKLKLQNLAPVAVMGILIGFLAYNVAVVYLDVSATERKLAAVRRMVENWPEGVQCFVGSQVGFLQDELYEKRLKLSGLAAGLVILGVATAVIYIKFKRKLTNKEVLAASLMFLLFGTSLFAYPLKLYKQMEVICTLELSWCLPQVTHSVKLQGLSR